MKLRSIRMGQDPVLWVAQSMMRRQRWIMDGLTPRKAANLMLAGGEFALRRETMRAWPVVAKVDISPLCNLRCTICVHATPSEGHDPMLAEQRFSASQRMPVERYREIVREMAGRTAAVSLYYLGDPLMHPHLEEICDATREAGINAHASSNFSFALSDERLRGLLTCGLTHLTVCVDGMTQEVYGKTRVGGRIDLVLDNLKRLLRIRREMGGARLRVEVQYIRFRHNLFQLEAARAHCAELGVDAFAHFPGSLTNYTDAPRHAVPTIPRARRALPHCAWPFFSLVIRYDGGVIPCCHHHIPQQYARGADPRVLGNVFEHGVREVWNSPAYRALRRVSADPGRSATEPGLSNTFCQSCPSVFDRAEAVEPGSAEQPDWSELYEHDARGRVVRRARPLVQIGAGRAAAARGVDAAGGNG